MLQAPPEAFSQTIAVNMCGVDVTIKRPGGAIRIPGVKVLAKTAQGQQVEVKKHTTPGFIIDEKTDHPLWAALDDNGRDI